MHYNSFGEDKISIGAGELQDNSEYPRLLAHKPTDGNIMTHSR